MKTITKTTLSLAALAGLTLSANAAVIAGVSAVASSQFNATSGSAPNLVNGNGFTELDPIETSTHLSGGWPTSAHWFAVPDLPYVDFDLGGTYTVGKAHVWNYNGNPAGDLNWGILEFTLIFSTDATFGNGDDTSQSFSISKAPGTDTYTGEHYPLTPAAGVTNIRLQVDTNINGSFTGLSEVRFSDAIPEPSAAALLGLGGLALLRRRRK